MLHNGDLRSDPLLLVMLLPPLMFELKGVVFGLNCEREAKLVILLVSKQLNVSNNGEVAGPVPLRRVLPQRFSHRTFFKDHMGNKIRKFSFFTRDLSLIHI